MKFLMENCQENKELLVAFGAWSDEKLYKLEEFAS